MYVHRWLFQHRLANMPRGEACAPGKYKSTAGSASCEPCPAGHISPPGSRLNSSCTIQCWKGSTGKNGGPCYACQRDMYKDTTSNATCVRCPLSANAPVGSGQRADCVCNSGYYGKMYSDTNGNATCKKCPQNADAPVSSVHSTDCFCNRGYCGDAASGNCSACQAGSYAHTTGLLLCLYCPTGK